MPGRENNPAASWPISIASTDRAQRQSSVIPVTNFVFNAAWQRLRLSAGPLGRYGRSDWSAIRAPARKALISRLDGRTRPDAISLATQGDRTKRTDGHTPYIRVCPSVVPSIVLVRFENETTPLGSFFHCLFRGVRPKRETILFRTRDQTKGGRINYLVESDQGSFILPPKPVHPIPGSLLHRSFFQNGLHRPCKGLSLAVGTLAASTLRSIVPGK